MNWLETVPRAAQGDIAAWEALYTATRREACFVALKVCGTSQDAEDLTQEAYLTAFEKLPQLQEAEKFSSWLYMIVVNKCRDYLKKKKPTLFTELQKDDAPAPDWTDDRGDDRRPAGGSEAVPAVVLLPSPSFPKPQHRKSKSLPLCQCCLQRTLHTTTAHTQ